jgi:hypothetical protein
VFGIAEAIHSFWLNSSHDAELFLAVNSQASSLPNLIFFREMEDLMWVLIDDGLSAGVHAVIHSARPPLPIGQPVFWNTQH